MTTLATLEQTRVDRWKARAAWKTYRLLIDLRRKQKWDLLPPEDPFLLKRITEYFFAIVGEWKLTTLEKGMVAATRVRV